MMIGDLEGNLYWSYELKHTSISHTS